MKGGKTHDVILFFYSSEPGSWCCRWRVVGGSVDCATGRTRTGTSYQLASSSSGHVKVRTSAGYWHIHLRLPNYYVNIIHTFLYICSSNVYDNDNKPNPNPSPTLNWKPIHNQIKSLTLLFEILIPEKCWISHSQAIYHPTLVVIDVVILIFLSTCCQKSYQW